MIRLILSHNAGYPWRTLARGPARVHYKGNDWEIGAAVARWAARAGSTGEDLLRLLAQAPFPYSVALEEDGSLFAATDRLRGHPLFYRHQDGRIVVTDDPYAPGVPRVEADAELPMAEFLLAGYVTGGDTLSRGLRSLRAGEALVASGHGDALRVELRAGRAIDQPALPPAADFTRLAMETCDEVFADLVRGLAGRQAVLPLSSGVDSRFIACMLKRHGHTNVATFTYGRPGNWEEATSRRVAVALGYAWHFVPYSRERWREWYAGADMRAYRPFCSRHVATPHIQDWPAVMELKRRGLLEEGAVFVPGHTSILIANRLERWAFEREPRERVRVLAELLCRHHFMLQRECRVIADPSRLRRRILTLLPPEAGGDPHALLNAYFHFEASERHAKMLINSVRVYEFWGYAWAMPLWDGRLVDLWARVPYEGRYSKRAFRDFLHSVDLYGLFPRPAGPGLYDRLRQIAKDNPLAYPPLKRLKCAEERLFGYFHHFLDWYGIVSYPRYVYEMGRCGNIYSLLSRHYLEALASGR